MYRPIYLAIIEWGWIGYEEFCRSRRVLSTEAEGTCGHVTNRCQGLFPPRPQAREKALGTRLRKTTHNLHFQVQPVSKTFKENGLLKWTEDALQPWSIHAFVQNSLLKIPSNKNFALRSSLGLSYKPCRLPLKKCGTDDLWLNCGTLQGCNWTRKRQKTSE